MNEEDDDDDDESDDEDFDPDASDEDASGRDSDDSGGSDEYSSASENGEDEIRSTKKVLKKRSPKKSAAKVPDDHIRDGIAEEESLLEDENNCLSNSTEDTKVSFFKEEDRLSEQHECISPKEESARKKIRLQSPQNSATYFETIRNNYQNN